MTVLNKIKQFIHDSIYIENSVVSKIFNVLNAINVFYFIIAEIIFYGLGIFLNAISPFPCFHLYQGIFLFIFTTAIFSIRYYEKAFFQMKQLQIGDNILSEEYEITYRVRRSTINLIIPIIFGAYFGIQAMLLVNVNICSISAAYLVATYIICVLPSFWGYLQFLYFVIYIHRLRKRAEEIKIYEKNYPSNTSWIESMAKLSSNYRNIFFLLGMIYIFAVIFFVLSDNFFVMDKIMNNILYAIPLMLFIGGVFIAIVLFFPICSGIEYFDIKKIINILKLQSVKQLKYAKRRYTFGSPGYLQKSRLIIDIFNTPTYPFKDALGILYSTMVTMINLTAAIVTIIQFNYTI